MNSLVFLGKKDQYVEIFFCSQKKPPILHDIFFYSFRIKADVIDNMYWYTGSSLCFIFIFYP